MKKIITLSLLGIFVILSACNNDDNEGQEGRQMGKLYLSKAKPQPGETLLLRYENGEQNDDTETTLNYLINDKMYSYDIDMKDSSGVLVGKIQIPDSAQAITFNFNKNGHFDSNDKKGYTIPLYNEDGKEVPGARANIGTYYTSIGEQYDLEMESDSAMALIENDFKENPEIAEPYDAEVARLFLKNNPEKGKNYLDTRIKYYENKDSLNEQNYETLSSLYRLQHNKAKSDSLQTLAREQFPKGNAAQAVYVDKAYNAKTAEERVAILKKFEDSIGTSGKNRDYILQYVARAYADENNPDKFLEYTSKIKSDQTRASLYNNTAWSMAENGNNLDKAEQISKKSLEAIEKEQQESDEKPDHYTKKQYEKALKSTWAMYSDTYGFINFKMGNLEKALEVQEKAVSENSDAEINTRYVQFLLANKKYDKAQEEAAKFLRENRAGDEMTNYLEKAYAESKGSKDGFESYLAAIEKEARDKMREALQEERVDEEAPQFVLKDLEGNEVALSSLKGKTVILDFWATWCGPCKASFPGMKTAVEKFQENPNVEFYFVDTFENTPSREKDVAGFIKDHDYPFHVLIDETEAENSNSFKTANAFGITGIPTKVVIGPEGNIQFKLVGYGGNNAKMVEEIGLMIELTQDQTSPEA